MRNFLKLITSVVACELVGILGAIFTTSAIPTWYATINKPFFSPPNWVFGPVWTSLYLLMGISLYLIWAKGLKKKSVKSAVNLFIAQLTLNFIWSPAFFGLKSPLFGLIVITFLWCFIVMTMKKFYPLSKMSFYLLVPYLFWVSFATILNASIFLLN